MADDAPVVHIGENSPEYIAYKLLIDISKTGYDDEKKKKILDNYAECLEAVTGRRRRGA